MKKRATIETEMGAIRAITKGPWVAAAEQLERANAAITAMKAASDRIAYEAAWATAIDALELFWVRLNDEGKRAVPGFAQWLSAEGQVRRDDQLLQYLIQARHKNQHERAPLAWSEPRIKIDVSGGGAIIQNLQIAKGGEYEIEYQGGVEPRVVRQPGDPVLPAITNRGVVFAPPTEHLGAQFLPGPGSPLRAAEKALEFYSNILFQVLDKFPGK